jgi:hypothetical protein
MEIEQMAVLTEVICHTEASAASLDGLSICDPRANEDRAASDIRTCIPSSVVAPDCPKR